jgi:hypothetical protein
MSERLTGHAKTLKFLETEHKYKQLTQKCETTRTRENESDTRDNTEYSPTLNGLSNP